MKCYHHICGTAEGVRTIVSLLLIVLATAAVAANSHPAAGPVSPVTSLRIEVQESGSAGSAPFSGGPILLKGSEARQQVLVTATLASGALEDCTRAVEYCVVPEGIVRVDATGLLVPVKDGSAALVARTKDGISASAPVLVEKSGSDSPINFANQIVPIFTKAGCNAGGCHGKSGGQNGFRLSLLGFEPSEDYEYLVKESRGRRVFPAAPERSLLLLKPTATVPHGGGKRLEIGSDEYRLLVQWIRQGMPYGRRTDPTVARIDVFPKQRTMPLGGEQQLVVTASYTDGSKEDVTRSALFEPNDKDMARIDERGLVKLFEQPGDAAVMVRYQSKVAVFRAAIPLGAPVEHLPSAHNFIDELVFKKLRQMGMPPSPICDDATFVRRAAVDIAGRLPTAEEATAFLANTNPNKRGAWVETLLQSAGYADYFANKWSALLRNRRGSEQDVVNTFAFHDWVRESFLKNKRYDFFVREILAASGDVLHNPPVAWYRQLKEPNAELEDTAQLFLGMRLQCAQCHHHPFERWSQQDYYQLAAYFTQVGRKRGDRPGEEVIFHKRGLASAINKKTQQRVEPAPLGGQPVKLGPDDDPRQALADWLADPRNPYFAKALVNRYWKHFFNRGLVDPEDDMRETNPATNPELLDALAQHFIQSHYDLKELVRTICRSVIYQLSEFPNPFNRSDKQNFSRFYPKRLTAEVLYDAVNQMTRSATQFDGLPRGTRAIQLPDNSYNNSSYFLAVFGRPDASSSCECERSQDASLAQSLHLLNAQEIQAKLTDDHGRAAALALDDTRPDPAKIADLYFSAYARAPQPKELELALAYLAKSTAGRAGKEVDPVRRRAFEDILWALLNTKEFLFNH